MQQTEKHEQQMVRDNILPISKNLSMYCHKKAVVLSIPNRSPASEKKKKKKKKKNNNNKKKKQNKKKPKKTHTQR